MAASGEKPYDFMPPGGQFEDLVGAALGSTTAVPTKMIHHITSTAIIATITPPWEGYSGPLYLIADSLFSITTAGNIGANLLSTLTAGHAYGFIYDRKAAKWYPIAAL